MMRFFRRRSTATIVGALQKIITKLEAHIDTELQEAIRKTEEAARLLGQRQAHHDEVANARAWLDKIKPAS